MSVYTKSINKLPANVQYHSSTHHHPNHHNTKCSSILMERRMNGFLPRLGIVSLGKGVALALEANDGLTQLNCRSHARKRS